MFFSRKRQYGPHVTLFPESDHESESGGGGRVAYIISSLQRLFLTILHLFVPQDREPPDIRRYSLAIIRWLPVSRDPDGYSPPTSGMVTEYLLHGPDVLAERRFYYADGEQCGLPELIGHENHAILADFAVAYHTIVERLKGLLAIESDGRVLLYVKVDPRHVAHFLAHESVRRLRVFYRLKGVALGLHFDPSHEAIALSALSYTRREDVIRITSASHDEVKGRMPHTSNLHRVR